MASAPNLSGESKKPSDSPFGVAAPSLSLPKGGGAIRGIGEKFSANPVTGTGSMSIPIATSPGRSGFAPQLSLSYDSGAGNGPFGLGWQLGLPSISRRTEKGLPKYEDEAASDVFILSGAEDLVPTRIQDEQGQWVPEYIPPSNGYTIMRYWPRIEGLFSRIERWTRTSDGDTYWRSISKDNVTTFYGKTPESRIADPDDPRRIFTWLICESYDDKGNSIAYEYIAENSSGVDVSEVNERNRNAQTRSANRYIKRIKYGNTVSRLITPNLAEPSWLFEVVFDYGEGHCVAQMPDVQDRVFATASITGAQTWPVRQDPFSHYRASFEVRTYRLCRRVLMFHHFAQELGTPDCLVSATEFTYQENSTVSFITGVTQSGFVRQSDGTYLKRSLPDVEFEYSQAQVQQQINEVDPESLVNLPARIGGQHYRWLDLDGEGLQSILIEQEAAWYYKRNLSPLTFKFSSDGKHTCQALFEPLSTVTKLPSTRAQAPRHQFMDLAGDGQLDCVVLERPVAGFFERTEEEDWETFQPFALQPNIDWNDPNLRLVDLNGDGHADVLVTENEVFSWHPSLAEAGFGAALRVAKAQDEEKGPAIILADSTQSIFLADMSGDGLTDIVRIRNGEVCYWPNLGYGRFGRKVAMKQAPWFEAPDLFDPRRIRLADIDGSGTTDILYLASDGVHLYFNQSGNAWSLAERITSLPLINDQSSIEVLDLLGNGTACLVWTTSLLGEAGHTMRYVDLMGGQKPHLLVRSRNNLGAETRIFYAPSTKFYLADRQAGQPWVTRLPFPVHVVERMEIYDWVSRNRFVTRYTYHHGYFDGIEREFRGFGRVDQIDTEELGALSQSGTFPNSANIDAASYVPPVLTKTWFHTGTYPQYQRVSRLFEKEYYRESDLSEGIAGLTEEQFLAMQLPDTVLPPELGSNDLREAVRSLKGAVLRQEVYALDGTNEAARPYKVSEQNYTIKRLQPCEGIRYGVFFTHARESIDFHYERKLYKIGERQLADPRVTHNMVLDVDEYGNVKQSVSIGYGRRHDDASLRLTAEDHLVQKRLQVTCSENTFTNPILAMDAYRPPMPAETRTYHLVKVTPQRALPDITNLFGFDEMIDKVAQAGDGQHDLPYEDIDAHGTTENHPYRRLIEQVRTLYRKDNLTGGLPLGTVESHALPFERYQLAFPSSLLSVYRRNGQPILPDPMSVLRNEGRYVLSNDKKIEGLFPTSDADGLWWIPSGQMFFSSHAADTPAQELDDAQHHFFLPRRFRDPFGNVATVLYDGYDLLPLDTEDALHNKVTVGERDGAGNITNGNDYRVLHPARMMDPNGNRSHVVFDGLGLVAGTAVMGKLTENLGDSLSGFAADLTQAQIDQFFADPKGPIAASLLQGATSRIIYDLNRFRRLPATLSPGYAATIVRETHLSELQPDQTSKLQVSLSYSDGFEREIQKKIQAEPGSVPKRDPATGRIITVNGQPEMTPNEISPRWVGSGWTVFNNKGKPVRQYEPFFTDTHDFEFDVRIGVSSVLFYDPIERVVATLHPNHTWEKVVFDPWQQASWDVNDTVLIDNPKTDPDAGSFFARLPDEEYLPTWYAQRQGGALGTQEQAAARRAAVHAQTFTAAYADALGRTFLTIAHSRAKYSDAPPTDPPIEEFQYTRILFDIEGNQRQVIDAKDRVVMRYDYDMLGNRIHQASMEAGERWILNDVAGKPLYAWDSRNHQFRTAYDPLRRPTDTFLREGAGAGAELQVGRTLYGEAQPNPETHNLRGKVFQLFDQAGIVTSDEYDFKGNLLRSQRQLAQAYKTTLDWSTTVPLETDLYTSRTRYDALNRPTEMTAPDHSVIRPGYNEANLLERVDANLRGATVNGQPTWTPFVTDIDYDAKGQRTLIQYGSGATQDRQGVTTTYAYDPLTFRLVHLLTRRDAAAFPNDCPQSPPAGWPGCQVQNLHYTYDPVGNITAIRDDAQQTIYFRNRRVEPSAEYTYDALYRLIEAKGREHLGQIGGAPIPHSYNDAPRVGINWSANDGNAMGTYTERYVYDAVGNFLEMQHHGRDPVHPGWTRTYAYHEPSLLEPGKQSNRLTSTTIGATTETYSTGGDGYDAHGNMLHMPQLQIMQWDFKDQLQMTQRQAVNTGDEEGIQRQGERTWYVYDASGQRVRKVTELATGQLKDERIYLGGFEIYRRQGVNPIVRETLHIMDDKQRIALVETRTQGDEPGVSAQLIRYQFSNHLGSASLELDDQAQIISYEEYTPYGSTSYQAVRSQTETPKRYRYTGKERDEESGLYYHGARYYAVWLGRWTSTDPVGVADTLHLYQYGHSNPIMQIDPDGEFSKKTYDDWLKNSISAQKSAVEARTDKLESSKKRKSEVKEQIAQLESKKTELQHKRAKVITERKTLESKATRLSAKEMAALKAENNQIIKELGALDTKKASLESELIRLNEKIETQTKTLTRSTEALGKLEALQAKFDTVYTKATSKMIVADVELLTDIVMNEARDSNIAAKTAIAYAYTNDTAHHMKKGHVTPPPATGSGGISHYSAGVTERRFKNAPDKVAYINSVIDSLEAASKRLADQTNAQDPTSGATNWVSPGADYEQGVPMKVKYPPHGMPKWARSMQQIIVSGVPADVFTFLK